MLTLGTRRPIRYVCQVVADDSVSERCVRAMALVLMPHSPTGRLGREFESPVDSRTTDGMIRIANAATLGLLSGTARTDTRR